MKYHRGFCGCSRMLEALRAASAATAAERAAVILQELLLIKASIDTWEKKIQKNKKNLHHSDGNRQVMFRSNLSPLTTSGGGKFKLRVRVLPHRYSPPPQPGQASSGER